MTADAFVRYAIPESRLPALSAKYGVPCAGAGRPVRMKEGRGYRQVICGELSNPPLMLTVDPFTGRVTVAPVVAR